MAGLDWTVEQTPVFMDDGTEIKNYKANIRSDDKTVLGIVTNRYKIVQNADAFSFTDAIVGETEDGIVRYETAGSLIWHWFDERHSKGVGWLMNERETKY